MNLPQVVAVRGQITKIAVESAANHEGWLSDRKIITINDKSFPKPVNVWVNDVAIASFNLSGILFEGNYVSLDVEQHIAGFTEYDIEGTTYAHEADGFTAVPETVTNLSDDEILAVTPMIALVELIDKRRKDHASAAVNVRPMVEQRHATLSVEDRIKRLQTQAATAVGAAKQNIDAMIERLVEQLPAAKPAKAAKA